jgi:hypothetical protein
VGERDPVGGDREERGADADEDDRAEARGAVAVLAFGADQAAGDGGQGQFEEVVGADGERVERGA